MQKSDTTIDRSVSVIIIELELDEIVDSRSVQSLGLQPAEVRTQMLLDVEPAPIHSFAVYIVIGDEVGKQCADGRFDGNSVADNAIGEKLLGFLFVGRLSRFSDSPAADCV